MGAPAANQIGDLGSFDTNLAGTSDPIGFQLRDGRPLLVDRLITDHGTTASLVSIAVAPMPAPATYSAGDLTLTSLITADPNTGTVKLQATGNVSEMAGGLIQAATLIAQAGVVPDTEGTAGNTPGQVPTTTLPGGSVSLGNINQLGTLGASTAAGDFLLVNGQDLVVAGTVLAGANTASFDATRSATITALAGAGTAGNLTIDAGAPIKAGGNVSLNAAATIANGDTVTKAQRQCRADGRGGHQQQRPRDRGKSASAVLAPAGRSTIQAASVPVTMPD